MIEYETFEITLPDTEEIVTFITKRDACGAVTFPADESNSDYQQYLLWLEEQV